MKKLLKGVLIFFGVIVLLGACASLLGEEEAAPTPQEVKAEPVKEEEKAPEPKERAKKEEAKPKPKQEEKKEEPKEEPPSNEVFEGMALNILEENFAGVAEIAFDKETKFFTLTPTDPRFALEIGMMIEGTKSLDDWENLVESTVSMSKSNKELLGSGYSIALMNPANTDNVLLVVVDGVVFYNAFE
ncbi:hypothetical protein BhaS171_00049 [Bacillus phage vB_BhaS-171]|uniref:hypothetical protein n=1 Tax=Bacillus phage vB_BhaS-171 TaxID=1775140 RepID=UPI000744A182|nr:hypothetical protein BH781_gp49 [Bacillus phage vB_BhaS-171]ALY08105.1 hypothetical protein BhaS171_00049 [Bacillus phage vB_BhaS-171]